jgi:serine/threonine-protein kinase
MSLFALTIGTVVSERYEILGALGRGGMGIVYRAQDRELNVPVAIKVLRPEAVATPELQKRLRAEITLARKVSHPNVCRIYEYGRQGHLPYIVMELVDGPDLRRLLKERGPLPPEEAYDVTLQITEALSAIHRAGVVHRDLKPANVIRNVHGVVKLMDFGIARSFAGDGTATAITGTGEILGTPEYMSPEQVRAEAVDARSDLYSLGVLVFELFTGKVPFRDNAPIATVLQHLQTPVRIEGVPLLPEALLPVLRKALAKEREQRFTSAREMGEAIRRAQGGVETPSPVSAEVRRSLTVIGVVSAILIVIAVVVVAVFRRPSPAEHLNQAAITDSRPLPTREATVGAATAAPPGRPEGAAPALAETARPRNVVRATRSVEATPSAPTMRPTSTRADTPSATEAPRAGEAAETAEMPTGLVQLGARPWAEVFADEREVGVTPMAPVPLEAGPHTLRFENPGYQPVLRKIVIHPGKTEKVFIDLTQDAVPR